MSSAVRDTIWTNMIDPEVRAEHASDALVGTIRKAAGLKMEDLFVSAGQDSPELTVMQEVMQHYLFELVKSGLFCMYESILLCNDCAVLMECANNAAWFPTNFVQFCMSMHCIDRVLVELSPVRLQAQVGTTEEFHCSYSSRLRFRIVFLTFPDWKWLLADEMIRYKYKLENNMYHPGHELNSYILLHFGKYRLPPPQLQMSLTVRIPIFPKLQRVICRLVNDNNETVAEVYSIVKTTETTGFYET